MTRQHDGLDHERGSALTRLDVAYLPYLTLYFPLHVSMVSLDFAWSRKVTWRRWRWEDAQTHGPHHALAPCRQCGYHYARYTHTQCTTYSQSALSALYLVISSESRVFLYFGLVWCGLLIACGRSRDKKNLAGTKQVKLNINPLCHWETVSKPMRRSDGASNTGETGPIGSDEINWWWV